MKTFRTSVPAMLVSVMVVSTLWCGSMPARGEIVYQTSFDGLSLGRTQPVPGSPGQDGWYRVLTEGDAFGEIQGAIARDGRALHEHAGSIVPAHRQTIDQRRTGPLNVAASSAIILSVDFFAHSSNLGAVNSYRAFLEAAGGPHPSFGIVVLALGAGNGTPKGQTGVSVGLRAFNGATNNEPIPLWVGEGLAWNAWHSVTVALDHEHDTYLYVTVDGQSQDLTGFRPPRSFDGARWLRGQSIEVLAAGIIPDDVGGDRTDDDVYWDNLRLEVILPIAGGRILWEDRLDVGGEALPIERVTALAARGNLVVAASHMFDEDNDRFLLRAYDARAGSIAWDDATHPTDEFGATRPEAGLRAVATNGIQAFAAGFSGILSDGLAAYFFVRAYDARSGAILWEDPSEPGYAIAIAHEGARVFAAGASRGFYVRAYDARTGTRLWEDRVPATYPFLDWASAVAAHGAQVYVAGNAGTIVNQDFVVRAYNARTGALVWEDRLATAGLSDGVLAISAYGNRVFTAGQITSAGRTECGVRAHDARTGVLLWEDRLARARFGAACATAAQGHWLFAAGGDGFSPSLDSRSVVRVYDARTGAVLWEDQRVAAVAHVIAAQGRQVFVGGTVLNTFGEDDLLVTAYQVQ